MEDLLSYAQSLNPKKDEQAILIYESSYKLWREGNFIGVAKWKKDEIVGDSFQIVNSKCHIEVYVADKWELVINPSPPHT